MKLLLLLALAALALLVFFMAFPMFEGLAATPGPGGAIAAGIPGNGDITVQSSTQGTLNAPVPILDASGNVALAAVPAVPASQASPAAAAAAAAQGIINAQNLFTKNFITGNNAFQSVGELATENNVNVIYIPFDPDSPNSTRVPLFPVTVLPETMSFLKKIVKPKLFADPKDPNNFNEPDRSNLYLRG